MDGEAGYCTTSGCVDSSDCEVGWYCLEKNEMAYCHKPLSGLGARCKDDSDCAEFEATFCESFATKMCLVVGCSADEPCPRGYSCCDLTPTGFFEGTQCNVGDDCAFGEKVHGHGGER